MGHLTVLSAFRLASDDGMTDEFERIWKEVVMA
jgi:hypothetical protein